MMLRPLSTLGFVWLTPFLASVSYGGEAFIIPPACNGHVTDDPATEGSAPAAWITYTNGIDTKYLDISIGSLKYDRYWTRIYARAGYTYAVYAVYTPFLLAKTEISVPTDRTIIVAIPKPGTSSDNSLKLYPSVTFTIVVQGKPVPNAIVEVIPYYPGSDPVDIQADENGQFTAQCYTQIKDGNPVTVLDQDGNWLLDGTLNVTGESENGATGTNTAYGAVPP